MNTPGVPATGNGALELPPFSLDVQALDLGNEVKAVGLELVETENREPVRGKEGAEIWSEVFPGLAGKDPFVVDFFSHIDRVREFCKARKIEWRETADSALEGDLSWRGLDAYQQSYTRYTFCAVCEPDDGWATILSEALWPSERIRRLRPAVQRFDVHIARPN